MVLLDCFLVSGRCRPDAEPAEAALLLPLPTLLEANQSLRADEVDLDLREIDIDVKERTFRLRVDSSTAVASPFPRLFRMPVDMDFDSSHFLSPAAVAKQVAGGQVSIE